MPTSRKSFLAIRNDRSRRYVKIQKSAVAAPYRIVPYASGCHPCVRT